jgi:hypothetical protein
VIYLAYDSMSLGTWQEVYKGRQIVVGCGKVGGFERSVACDAISH